VKIGIFVIGLILLCSGVSAQESYSISASAQQVTDLTNIVTARNEKLCQRFSLALACTQAQVCTAASTPGGASCTAAQARTAGVRIFPLTQAGREEYVTFQIAAPAFNDQKAIVPSWLQKKACDTWQTQNQTERNTACAAHSLPNGCLLYPTTCG
jgi:hypothetical protein